MQYFRSTQREPQQTRKRTPIIEAWSAHNLGTSTHGARVEPSDAPCTPNVGIKQALEDPRSPGPTLPGTTIAYLEKLLSTRLKIFSPKASSPIESLNC